MKNKKTKVFNVINLFLVCAMVVTVTIVIIATSLQATGVLGWVGVFLDFLS